MNMCKKQTQQEKHISDELQGCRWDTPLAREGGSTAIPLNHQQQQSTGQQAKKDETGEHLTFADLVKRWQQEGYKPDRFAWQRNRAPESREGQEEISKEQQHKTYAANSTYGELQGSRWDPPHVKGGGSSAIPLNHQKDEHCKAADEESKGRKQHNGTNECNKHTQKETHYSGELQGCRWDPPLDWERGVRLRFP